MSNEPERNPPALKIVGPLSSSGVRSMKYQKIAAVHRQIIEEKYRARNIEARTGKKMVPSVRPELVIHLEDSVAFLAEELLKLQTAFEGASIFQGRLIAPLGPNEIAVGLPAVVDEMESATGPDLEETEGKGSLPVDDFGPGPVADSPEEKP